MPVTIPAAVEIDIAVRGCETRKAPLRLRQLTLATDPIAAAGLVPGDGDVDEPLEEVPLGRLGCSPDVLERLVRLEVFAPLDLRESKS
jgi:hypothetical protein